MKQSIMILWISFCIGQAGATLAQTPTLSPDDLARIARECRDPQPTPFRSTADIQREVACSAAAFEMLRRAPPAAPGPVVSMMASLGTWTYRYTLDGAMDTQTACVVSGTLTLPAGRPVSLRVMSEDTIHQFQLPALGIKMDAVPGRLNERVVHAEAAAMVEGMAVTAEGTVREQKAPLSVRFLSPDDYARWERDTLRARGCGVVR